MPDIEPSPESPTQPRAVIGDFECDLRFSGRAAAWIRVSGKLDLASAQQFTQSVEEAFSGALMVIVDLRQLAFIDGPGLQGLIEAGARARRTRRRLVVIRGATHIDRLCDLVGARLEIIDVKPVLVSRRDG